jgi:hypothetical protein
MRRLIICSCLYGSVAAPVCLRRLVDARRPDGVLFAGGIAKPRSP